MDDYILVTSFLIIMLLLDIIATIRPSRQAAFNHLVGMIGFVVVAAVVVIRSISDWLAS